MKTMCEYCDEPCDTVQGYEDVADEFGNQRHYIQVSACCHDEIYKIEEEE